MGFCDTRGLDLRIHKKSGTRFAALEYPTTDVQHLGKTERSLLFCRANRRDWIYRGIALETANFCLPAAFFPRRFASRISRGARDRGRLYTCYLVLAGNDER